MTGRAPDEKHKKAPPQGLGLGGSGGTTVSLEYIEAGVKSLHKTVNAAYDQVKDNPTVANFAQALKGEFGAEEWYKTDSPDAEKQIGSPEKVQAVDTLFAGMDPNTKITPDMLGGIASRIQNLTSGPVASAAHHGMLGADSPMGGALNSFMNSGAMAGFIQQIEQFFGGVFPQLVGMMNGGVEMPKFLQPDAPAPGAAPAMSMAAIPAPTLSLGA